VLVGELTNIANSRGLMTEAMRDEKNGDLLGENVEERGRKRIFREMGVSDGVLPDFFPGDELPVPSIFFAGDPAQDRGDAPSRPQAFHKGMTDVNFRVDSPAENP
jgi:hypothetical protein